MNCKKCGNILNEGTTICPICGEPVTTPQVNNSVGGNVLPNNNLNTPPIQPNVNSSQTTTNLNQMPQVNQPILEPSVAQPIMPDPMAQTTLQGSPNMPGGSPIAQQSTPSSPTPVVGNQPNNMNQQTPPKNNKSFLIIVIVLVVAIIAVVVFIITNLPKQNTSTPTNDSKTTEKDNEKETTSNKDDEKDDKEDKNPSDKVSVENQNIYESNGYKFTIPNDIKSINKNNALYISNGSDFQYTFSPFGMDYATIIENPNAILEPFTEKNAIVKNYFEKTYSGQKFFLINISISGVAEVCFVSPIDDYYVALGCGQATSTSGHEKALNYISKIIASAEKSSSFAPSEEEKFIPNFDTGSETIAAVEFTLN